WAEGGGCIHRNIEDAWSVYHDIPYVIGVDTGKVDDHSVDEVSPSEPGVTHIYDVTYIVENIMTVEWVMRWKHKVEKGTPENPELVVIHYRRTSGSDFMPYWEGSIMLERVNDDVTAAFVHDEIQTMRTDAES